MITNEQLKELIQMTLDDPDVQEAHHYWDYTWRTLWRVEFRQWLERESKKNGK